MEATRVRRSFNYTVAYLQNYKKKKHTQKTQNKTRFFKMYMIIIYKTEEVDIGPFCDIAYFAVSNNSCSRSPISNESLTDANKTQTRRWQIFANGN